MQLNDIITRLESQVPEISGRTRGAAELAELVRQNALPNETPAAFVLPLGLRGHSPDAAAGLYRQSVDDTIGVVLMVEAAGDETGNIALPTVDVISDKIIAALAGWGPSNTSDIFHLVRGNLLSMHDGTVMYQLDFAIQNQLRIST